MKNKNKKLLIAMLIISIVFSTCLYADDIKSVTANIANYTFKYRGKEIKLTGKGGKKTLQPLEYNNDLYVPIQSIADLLNTAVKYDENNKIVEIGLKSDKGDSLIDILETGSNDIKYFIKTIDSDALTIGKETFDSGLVLLKPKKNSSYTRIFNLNKEYEKLYFKSIINGIKRKDNIDIKFVDIDRKIVLSIIDVSDDRTIEDYNISVKGVNKLQITISVKDKEINKYIMGDIYFK